jgi:YVTN family beta-propeller protein
MGPTARVLGEVQVIADGVPIDLGGSRQRRLLAALLVRRGSTVSTDQLVEAVFDGEASEAARRSFRTYVFRLRRALNAHGLDGTSIVVTAASGYSVPAALELDALRFEELLHSARQLLNDADPDGALRVVEEALSLWSGPAYCEFSDTEWARPEVFRLDELHVVAHEVHAAAMIESGRHAEAIAEVRSLVEREPLREEPRRLLMLALYRAGRHAEALRAGKRFRSELADETGLEWSRSLAELEQRIIARDPSLDAAVRGRQLHGYILGEQLVAAPSGVTYRASQPSVGSDVAITVIPPVFADDPEFIRRFETQAALIASIDHPNVVAVEDYWREPGAAYLVTRYVRGQTLAARLQDRTPVDADTAACWVDSVGDALRAAAERGVHHGALTAAEVVLDGEGSVHVTGFTVDCAGNAGRLDIAALAALAEQVWQRVDASPWSEDGAGVGAVRAVAAAVRRSVGTTSLDQLVVDLHTAGSRPQTRSEERIAVDVGKRPANPYLGLHAFAETDADVFFGRRALVEQLLHDLHRRSFVALVGPSGSGKSSVVRAGLVPCIRTTGAFVATMVPGRHPIAQLELALTRVATSQVPDLVPVLERPDGLVSLLGELLPGDDPELVLVVDQLEESMTLSLPEERDLLFDALARTVQDARGVFRVVATARADLLGRLLQHPNIGALLRDHTRLIAPLEAEELHAAIVEPAGAVGVTVEPELAIALVADSVDAPGSLPLLQFTLTELFERASDMTMTLDSYRRMGGLGTSIAGRAEAVYLALTTDDRAAARRLFSRLITPGEGAEDTRRRASASELTSVSASVIDRFGASRLLTFDRDSRTREPTVEVAHEALIRQWPRLGTWVDDDRTGLLVLRHLTASADAWDRSGGDPAELYRGGRLETALDWADGHDDDLTPCERAFLEASTRSRDDEIERERRRSRGLHTLVVALAVITAAAAFLGAVGVVQRQRADDQRARAETNELEAERQAAAANIERLTAQSAAAREQDSELAILLALEAYDRMQQLGEEPSGALISAMQTAVQSSRLLRRLDITGYQFGISPDGATALVAEGPSGDVSVIDVATGNELRRIDTKLRGVGDIVFSPTGDRVVLVEHFDTSLGSPVGQLFDARTFDPLGLIMGSSPCCGRTVRFSPDGRFLAVGDAIDGRAGEGSATVWDAGELSADPLAQFDGSQLIGWMSDAETVVLYDGSEVRFRRASSPEIDQLPAMAIEGVQSIDAHPDSDRLLVVRATGDNEVTAEIWPMGALEPSQRFERSRPATGSEGRFSPNGSTLLLFGGDDEIDVISPDTGGVLVLRTNLGRVGSVSAPTAGSPLLVTGDGIIQLWDVTAAGPPELGNLPTQGRIDDLWFSGDGSSALVVEVMPGGRRRIGAFDLELDRSLRSASSPPGADVVASDELVVFGPHGATPGRVESIDGSVTGITLDPCDRPEAIDGASRWLLVSPTEGACGVSSRIIDPTDGEVLAELAGRRVESADFGPEESLAQHLFVAEVDIAHDLISEPTGNDAASGIEVRRMPGGELLGSIIDERGDGGTTDPLELLRPRFSADGRYIAIGSDRTGGLVIDVRRLLDGDLMRDAIVASDGRYAGATTAADAGGSWLIGRSGSVLRFYDIESRTVAMTLTLDDGGAFKISPDGETLYYADGGVVRRFPLAHVELAALARSRTQRELTAAECERYQTGADCV